MAVDEETQGSLNQPYSGYFRTSLSRQPDMELVESDPGTNAGEYLRLFWQPICLESNLTDLPLAVRIMGEDLVVYRDRSGNIGVLHRHCSHRGTSLEYGIIAERGIRCCYHGWLFDADGTILDTPGEPSSSRLKDSFRHGAYPAVEFHGLIFAYMGPPGDKPPFPYYDVFQMPDTHFVPYSIWHSCNWLHVHENIIDAAHIVFLHSRAAGLQLQPDMAVMPVTEFRETDDGHGCLYAVSRRVRDFIWVRCIPTLLPNLFQPPALMGEIEAERLYTRIAMSRWTVPIDDTHCMIFGIRHFRDDVNDPEYRDRSKVGEEKIDFGPGQTMGRPYEEAQRVPGDWEVLVSQGPIPNHGREHRGTTDEGVLIIRRQFRRGIYGDVEPDMHMPQNGRDTRATFSFDTILRIPARGSGDDELVTEVGRRAVDIVLKAPEAPGLGRDSAIAERMKAMKESLLSERQT